jgi:hypothetical protein
MVLVSGEGLKETHILDNGNKERLTDTECILGSMGIDMKVNS